MWDEQQTAGTELPQIGCVTGDPSVHLGRLEEFVRTNGIVLTYSDAIAPAKGMAEKGKITLLPGQSPAEAFATLVHELAHSDMHFGERRANTNKRIRETEAEAVAYVICTAIGLEPGTGSQDCIGLYGGDSKLLLESPRVRTNDRFTYPRCAGSNASTNGRIGQFFRSASASRRGAFLFGEVRNHHLKSNSVAPQSPCS